MCTGHGDYGVGRATVVGWQRALAGWQATGAGGAVVERLPGADYRRGAPGIEPYAAAVWAAPWAVSTSSEPGAGRAAAPADGLCAWSACHRGRDGGSGVVVAAVRHGPADSTTDGLNALHGRLLTLGLCVVGRERRVHVALCWDRGWAILRRDAAHSLCRVC